MSKNIETLKPIYNSYKNNTPFHRADKKGILFHLNLHTFLFKEIKKY